MGELSWEVLGERLRKARTRLGLTQDQVAEAMHMSRPTISQIEAGKRPVNSLELARFARLYRIPVHVLLQEAEETEVGAEAYFRLAESTTLELKPAWRAVLLGFVEECRQYAELERMVLGRVGDLPVSYDAEKLGPSSIRQGEQAAELERKRLGIGDDPITNLPELLELQGVKVIARKHPEATELVGAALYRREFGPAILVNLSGSDLAPGRLNFTAAHEYAHLLFERELDTVDYEGYLTDPKPFERRANAFAASFLMPEPGILKELQSIGWRKGQDLGHAEVVYLSVRFGVSYKAMLWRLTNLGLITEEERAALYELPVLSVITDLGCDEKMQEHLGRWTEASMRRRFRMLVLQAYREGRISGGRAAQLLGVERSEFERSATMGVRRGVETLPK